MDIKSVSNSANAQPPKAQRVQEPTPEQKKERARQEHTEEPQPRPVVNTQGQTTGRLVNTTA